MIPLEFNCQLGHACHTTKMVNTQVGRMFVYDWDKYQDGMHGYYCTGRDDTSRTLINTGIWEPEDTEIIQKILEDGDRNHLVLDIGAHIGYYSVMASKLGYKVIAYEADRENVRTLKRNAKLNDVDIEVRFEHIDEDSVPEVFIEPILLLKCDIEGNEQWAVKKFESLFKNKLVQYAMLEISPVFNDRYPELVTRLRDYGYDVKFYHVPFDFNFDFEQRDLLFVRQP